MNNDYYARVILDGAFEVHRILGPGLLENAYKQCLAYELKKRGLYIEIEKEMPIKYKEVKLDCGYRIDILVEKSVIVELKSVERMNNLYLAQTLSYMKMADIKLGLLINFNTKLLKDGITRVVL